MEKEEQQQGKHAPTTITSAQTQELVDYDSDHALALALQQQENEFTMLEATESDEEEEADESHSFSTDYDERNLSTSQELAELELLGEEEEREEEEDEELEEESNMEELGEQDEIDPDELSYDELVALGDIIGQENQGLAPEEILSSLSPCICKSILSKPAIDRCVICQVEYEEGEDLVALRCEHRFHVGCISQWLQIKKICPICSKEVIKQKTE